MSKFLKFNSKIYRRKAIEEAISIYSNFAKFSFVVTGKYINVKMAKIKPSVKNIIVDEFTNYVLGLTKRCL